MDSYPRARRVAGIVALLGLAALTVLSLWSVLPPSPRGEDAPQTEFSAARAFTHVERIGSEIHVAGSPAADRVRDYIAATTRDLGLQTEIQDTVGGGDAFGSTYALARVRNVVALLPGTDPTGRVIMVAHYDSVQVSFGGNDDGAGVSTLLETARALAAGPAPRNDIVFVFTDAEEACLCGAAAFVEQHRYAADGGVVLNVEARGASGPAIMFETSAGNAGVVDVYGAAVPDPVGTSFAVEVYRILPNDTDFSPFRDQARFVGLNTAYIDGSPAYHTPEDTPANLDTASLQHHGGNALALSRAFGDADLTVVGTRSADDATYFPVLGLLPRYPGVLVWPLAAAALIGVLALAVVALRRRVVTGGRLAAAFGLGLLPLLAAPLLAQLLWLVMTTIRPEYTNMDDPWRPGWFRACVVALVAAAVLTWYGLLRRRIGTWSLSIGALLWLAVLGLVLAYATPGGSYLAALPALAVALAGVVALSVRNPLIGLAALVVGGAVAVVVLAPTVLLFFPALGLALGAAAALFATMLALALLPLLDYLFPACKGTVFTESEVQGSPVHADVQRPRRGAVMLVPAVVWVLAVAFLGVGLAVDRFDARHPEPTQLMYALDADSGQALWFSAESSPSTWTRQYVGDGTRTVNPEEQFPVLGDEDLLVGPAQAAPLPAPTVDLVSDATTGDRRTVSLLVRPQRPARLVYVRVEGGGQVLRANVAGRPLPTEAFEDGTFAVLFHAPPAEGVRIILEVSQAGPLRVRAMDGSDGLAGLPGFQARPTGVGIEGSHDSELVLVARTYTL